MVDALMIGTAQVVACSFLLRKSHALHVAARRVIRLSLVSNRRIDSSVAILSMVFVTVETNANFRTETKPLLQRKWMIKRKKVTLVGAMMSVGNAVVVRKSQILRICVHLAGRQSLKTLRKKPNWKPRRPQSKLKERHLLRPTKESEERHQCQAARWNPPEAGRKSETAAATGTEIEIEIEIKSVAAAEVRTVVVVARVRARIKIRIEKKIRRRTKTRTEIEIEIGTGIRTRSKIRTKKKAKTKIRTRTKTKIRTKPRTKKKAKTKIRIRTKRKIRTKTKTKIRTKMRIGRRRKKRTKRKTKVIKDAVAAETGVGEVLAIARVGAKASAVSAENGLTWGACEVQSCKLSSCPHIMVTYFSVLVDIF